MSIQESDWNGYIGSIWTDIFSDINLKKDGTIIEIAPGNINKIGRGLKEYGFIGTIYLVEPNKKSLDILSEEYEKQFSKNNIIPIQKNLREAISDITSITECDAILANHPLDDMIIGYFLDDNEFNELFNDHYGNSTIGTTNMQWTKLSKHPQLLDTIKDYVLEDWKTIINTLKPKNVVISQYESYFFKSNNIYLPDIHAQELLSRIKNYYSKKNYSTINIKNDKITDNNTWLLLSESYN
jgi:hypothetical protein